MFDPDGDGCRDCGCGDEMPRDPNDEGAYPGPDPDCNCLCHD